jgi:myo-inositol 2-dehydrogenase/D-chiro-inositol 1-dehydrogenase
MSESNSGGAAAPQTPRDASRRGFLKTSTLAAAGATFAGSLGIARSAHAAGDDTIRIGVIGCGGRGSGAANQALQTKGAVKLVAIGDAFQNRIDICLNALKAEVSSDRLDVPKERQFVGFDAYQKVLDCDIDLVILATPPGFRPIHFEAAVNAGKHVFMEKPVAVDPSGVRKVLAAVEIAKQKNLGVGVGLQRHHQPPYIETIKRLQDGAIGEILAARCYWNDAGVWVNPKQAGETEMHYQMRNWYYFNWLCGDHIVEQHIHNLDVINWVKAAYPVRAQGMGGRQVRIAEEYGEIFDHHAVEFEYADGSRMFSYCRHIPNCWSSVSEHVIGTKGTADISGARIAAAGQDAWRYRGPTPNAYQVEHDDLVASIRAGSPLNEGHNGAMSTMTAILGRLATYSGQQLSMDDALASEISLAPAKYDFDAAPPTPAVAVPGQTKVI